MPQLTNNIFDELIELVQGEVFIDKLRRYMLSTDGSIYKVEPACVVYPKNQEDVKCTVEFANKYGLSLHSRGAGSGLCGSAIGKGIILDFTKYMNKLIKIDYENKEFVCEPGYKFGELEVELKGKGLFFPPDPSSGEYATFGGMYGTNASGAHSVKYGNVSDYIIDAEVVLSDGSVISLKKVMETPVSELPVHFNNIANIYLNNAEKIEKFSYPHIKYNVAGYNLKNLVHDNKLDLRKLFGGSEGTLGVVTKLTFKLHDKPNFDSLVVAFFDDIISSATAVQKLMPLKPSGIEIMDKSLLNLAKEQDESLRDKIPDGIDNVLLIEFDGETFEECSQLAAQAQSILKSENLTEKAYLAVSAEEKAKYWAVRKAAVPILYKLKSSKKILALIEDAAVPIENLVEYFKGVYELLGRHKVDFVVYGHIAKGLMHTRPLLDLKDPHDVELLKAIADDFFELIHKLGGVTSGEHGDGRIRSAYIKKQYEPIYDLFLKIKEEFDPFHIFNPEIKTINDPYQMMKFLRYGKDYRSKDKGEKQLVWTESFEDEIEKCHGCSKCTTVTTATRMCPIYKFTRDEMAAPKAKANVLRALISGAIDNESLYESAFQYVIDHCVNCGSCHVECPSNVNIPKMAMEARARYTEKFGASLEKKLLVSAELAGRTTRKFSKFIGLPMKFKPFRKLGEMATGVSAEREFLTFKSKSLLERINQTEGEGEKTLIYFAGCYASYIEPDIGVATVTVLKKLGYKIITPEQHCCGLPMMTKGMVKQAKDKVKQNLKSWGKYIDEVEHIVVSCSSCGLALLKEWKYLLASEEIDKVADKLIHVSELVNRHNITISHPELKLAYHMPCHLKIQKAANSSIQMLNSVEGIEVEDLKSHCCGMAGSWGISKKNYDLSVEIGSSMIRKLNGSDAMIGVTDCPTCRMQMEHLSEKEIKHPIEVIAECMEENQ